MKSSYRRPCLRSLDYSLLVLATQDTYTRAYEKKLYRYGDFYYGPYVDGVVIQKLPSLAFADGSCTQVPLMVNHDFAEGPMFTNASVSTEAEAKDQLRTLYPGITPPVFEELGDLYPISEFASEEFLSSAFFTSYIFGAFETIFGWEPNKTAFWRLQAELGGALINCLTLFIAEDVVRASVPIWKFIYNAAPYIHGAYMGDLWGLSSQAANTTRADIVKAYVLSFVSSLDPSAVSYGVPRPNFPSYVDEAPNILLINDESYQSIVDPDGGARCAFRQAHSSISRN